MGVKSAVAKANEFVGKINSRYDMTYRNMLEIRDTYDGHIFDIICCSFRFGYIQGMKAAKAEMKRQSV